MNRHRHAKLGAWLAVAGLVAITASPQALAQNVQKKPETERKSEIITDPNLREAANLADLTRQMSEQVRRLAEDTATGMEPSAAKDNLIQDERELAQAMDEFNASLARKPSTFQLRQSYSGIDSTWHHLRARLERPGVSTFAMRRAARTADEMDAALHKALDLNPVPLDYYGTGPVPTGLAETRRLARALDDRAAYLSAVMQADMVNAPNRPVVVRDVVELVHAIDEYIVALAGTDRPDFAQNAFAPVAAVADRLERDLKKNTPPPPRVQNSWQALASAYVLIRQHLGLPVPPPELNNNLPQPNGGGDAVVALADRLLNQIDSFLQNFAPTVGVVPEGPYFLADAQRLREAASDFRADAARNLSNSQLAWEFRDVDALWQRLARRVNRVARGRTGPNIELAYQMGDTVAAIHRLLAMPGYPPVVAPAYRPPSLPQPEFFPDPLHDVPGR